MTECYFERIAHNIRATRAEPEPKAASRFLCHVAGKTMHGFGHSLVPWRPLLLWTKMMTAAQCRRQAKLSMESKDEEDAAGRTALLALNRSWITMANQIERWRNAHGPEGAPSRLKRHEVKTDPLSGTGPLGPDRGADRTLSNPLSPSTSRTSGRCWR